MSFPTTSVLDDFNRADGGLGANWTTTVIATYLPPLIATNVVKSTDSAPWYSDAYWDVETFGPDSEVFADVAGVGTNAFAGIYIRCTNPGGASLDGYHLRGKSIADAANDEWRIYRIDDGTLTQLGALITNEVGVGDTFGLEASGSTLTLYIKTGGSWASITTRTDATYNSAGYIGLLIQSSNWRLDNFGGGTIGAVAAAPERRTRTVLGVGR